MENSDQTILVTGATGNQGGSVARYLLQLKKFTVRALVRDKTKPEAQALQQAGAQLVEADLNNRASLDKAMRGVSGVFSMQDFKNGAEVEIRQGSDLADSAKAAGVSHFVYSSVGSAERHTGIPHFESKFQVEEHIRSIGLPYTILRPVFFFYNYNGMRPMIDNGTIYMPLSPGKKLQQLSEEDYGAMVAEVFTRPGDFMNREIEAASVDLTMTETAAAFSHVLGKNIAYQQIPFEAFEKQAGDEMTTMFRWFENVGYAADLTQLERDFTTLSALESWLRINRW